jgi:hypothetical protein
VEGYKQSFYKISLSSGNLAFPTQIGSNNFVKVSHAVGNACVFVLESSFCRAANLLIQTAARHFELKNFQLEQFVA